MSSSVYCFKNGYSLFRESHKVTEGASEFFISQLPALRPSHGSLWFESEHGACPRARSATQKQVERRDACSLQELLECNYERQVELLVGDEWMSCTLERVQGQLLVVRVKHNSKQVIPLADVKQVRGMGLQLEYEEKVERHGVVVGLQPGCKSLSVMLLTDDISYAPSYKVRFLSDQTLELVGRVCLLNDALDTETFEEVHCLAGVPTLNFQGIIDPMAQLQETKVFLRALASNAGDSLSRQGQTTLTNNMVHIGTQGANMSRPASSASNSDDLHIYTFRDVKCPKGSRVYMEMFDKTVAAYEDVYKADVRLGAYASDERYEDVHHSVRFPNSSGAPLTTGTCLVTRGDEQSLVCQTQLNFYPAGSQVTLKLTKALEVRCLVAERMQQTREKRSEGTTRVLFKYVAAGSFKLINDKDKAVVVTLKFEARGAVTSTTIDAVSRNNMDDRVKMTFQISIAPNSVEEIRFTREFWK